ncbi:FAD:protein FMN transferase [Prosthecobacter vanneervenii]|uniref:FAD:protein FMN transferase n=1 Tax=Prosthecobacter vanneervenii TaxID=48466 RepID=A0A7W7YD65_9BACT|nr:FAD:protein FMN transferase [Prosthecobacter vanneervenii]MBB5034031.1 thiamine biosynthesis lipoprotein [Prosthecobacter vanneervenii]
MRFALLLLLLCGCSRESPTSVGGHTMGTTWSLRVHPGSHLPPAAEIQQKLDAWESILSHWQPESALSRFNTSSSTDWISVPPELIEVVELAQRISTETNHAFDITLAPLIDLWGFGSSGRRNAPPSSEEITASKALCGWQHLHTRHDPPALRKDIPALRINVSAVAEGWALDHLAKHLESSDLHDFLLEIGGEVLAHGEWRVGIQAPAAPPGETAQTLLLRDQSIATSGVYRQHFMADGKEYAHILDPRTGSPIAHPLASVSVIHSSAALADGYATALLVLGPLEGRTLAAKLSLQAIWFERKK